MKSWISVKTGEKGVSRRSICLSLGLPAKYWQGHYLQDVLPQGIEVRVVGLSWTNPFPPSPAFLNHKSFYEGRLIQASKGLCSRVGRRASEAENTPRPWLFIASSQAGSLPPEPKLLTVTDVFSLGLQHTVTSLFLQVQGDGFSWHSLQICLCWASAEHGCTLLVELQKGIWACWGDEGKWVLCFPFS